MEYDPKIDKQYSCSKWSKGLGPQEVQSRHLSTLYDRSSKVKAAISHEYYDYKGTNATEENRYVIYRSSTKSRKLFIYIHGGFWQLLDLESSSFLGDLLVPNSVNYCAIGYNLAPKVSLDEIVIEIRMALKRILERHIDMEDVYLCGHSAGAHLALMSLVYDGYDDALSLSYSERTRLSGLVLISGMYDVRPIRFIRDNDNLHLNESSAWTLSPLRCIDNLSHYIGTLKLLVLVAQYDSPAFQQQSIDLRDSITSRIPNIDLAFQLVEGKDHFDELHDLGDLDYEVTNDLIRFIKS